VSHPDDSFVCGVVSSQHENRFGAAADPVGDLMIRKALIGFSAVVFSAVSMAFGQQNDPLLQ
jgi:hypothetical protein